MKLDKFAIPPTVMARQVGEELVILELSRGMYFGLDPVGARIWQLLSEGRSFEEICNAMVAEYEVPADILAQDVTRLLATLSEKGLIQPADNEMD